MSRSSFPNDRRYSKQFAVDVELSDFDLDNVMAYVSKREGKECKKIDKDARYDFFCGDTSYEHKADRQAHTTGNFLVEVFNWKRGRKQWLYNCEAVYFVVTSKLGIKCYRWFDGIRKAVLDNPLDWVDYVKFGGDGYGMQTLCIPLEKLERFVEWSDDWKFPSPTDVINARRERILAEKSP